LQLAVLVALLGVVEVVEVALFLTVHFQYPLEQDTVLL
jgi:hypothetical protein